MYCDNWSHDAMKLKFICLSWETTMDGFSKKSNEERARCRTRCREKLAQHIGMEETFL